MAPVADPLGGDLFRVYYSARDLGGRSWTTSCVIDLAGQPRLVEPSIEPHLAPGSLGTFDDRGAVACWLVDDVSPRRMYYVGWNTGTTVPFRLAIGLAYESADGKWEKASDGPLLDRSPTDSIFVASCCIAHEANAWQMWYVSCLAWEPVDGALRHRYLIKHATSLDGLSWNRNGHVAIGYQSPSEYAIARPTIIKDRELWHMWYSYRGDRYRIGYAQSRNGVDWTRLDNVGGLAASGMSWESDMVAYGHAFQHRGKIYMVYNGNDYGKMGFGIAQGTLPADMVSCPPNDSR